MQRNTKTSLAPNPETNSKEAVGQENDGKGAEGVPRAPAADAVRRVRRNKHIVEMTGEDGQTRREQSEIASSSPRSRQEKRVSPLAKLDLADSLNLS